MPRLSGPVVTSNVQSMAERLRQTAEVAEDGARKMELFRVSSKSAATPSPRLIVFVSHVGVKWLLWYTSFSVYSKAPGRSCGQTLARLNVSVGNGIVW